MLAELSEYTPNNPARIISVDKPYEYFLRFVTKSRSFYCQAMATHADHTLFKPKRPYFYRRSIIIVANRQLTSTMTPITCNRAHESGSKEQKEKLYRQARYLIMLQNRTPCPKWNNFTHRVCQSVGTSREFSFLVRSLSTKWPTHHRGGNGIWLADWANLFSTILGQSEKYFLCCITICKF